MWHYARCASRRNIGLRHMSDCIYWDKHLMCLSLRDSHKKTEECLAVQENKRTFAVAKQYKTTF